MSNPINPYQSPYPLPGQPPYPRPGQPMYPLPGQPMYQPLQNPQPPTFTPPPEPRSWSNIDPNEPSATRYMSGPRGFFLGVIIGAVMGAIDDWLAMYHPTAYRIWEGIKMLILVAMFLGAIWFFWFIFFVPPSD